MATLSMRTGATPRSADRFHFRMALVFVLIAFGGFVPTYWAPLAAGQLQAPPAMHLHGALLFGWTLFYLLQTGWIATGRQATHRAWGMAGISLFTLLVCSIVLLKITMLRIEEAQGFGEASKRFAAVALCALPVMIGLFALAIANVHRPQVHKRLMFSLMVAFMVPAIARVFLTLFAPQGVLSGGPPPPFVAVPPTFAALLLLGVAMLRDWRLERRIDAVYAWSGAAILGSSLATQAIARTDTWIDVATYVQHLAG